MKYRIVDDERSRQGSPEWLSFRKGKISASIAPTIMGDNPYQSRLELYDEIQNDIQRPKNEAMERGNRLEIVAREFLNNFLGTNYQPAVVQSIRFPDFIASLDGLYFDDQGKCHILEIKCPGEANHQITMETGQVPPIYHAQLQHQMDLMDVDEMTYLSFSESQKSVILDVQRDKEYCKQLFSTEMAFLTRLINFDPPPPEPRDWVEIIDLNKSKELERLHEINHQISCLEEEKESIRKEMIFDHPRVRIGNTKIQRIVRAGTVDYSKIEILQGIDLSPYRRKPTETLRIYD